MRGENNYKNYEEDSHTPAGFRATITKPFTPPTFVHTPSTTIALKTNYGEYTVTHNEVDLTIDEMIDSLIKPVLLAAGYHPDTVSSYLDCEPNIGDEGEIPSCC